MNPGDLSTMNKKPSRTFPRGSRTPRCLRHLGWEVVWWRSACGLRPHAERHHTTSHPSNGAANCVGKSCLKKVWDASHIWRAKRPKSYLRGIKEESKWHKLLEEVSSPGLMQ